MFMYVLLCDELSFGDPKNKKNIYMQKFATA